MIKFRVFGTPPEPKGSMKNVARRGQKAKLISANPDLGAWEHLVAYAAKPHSPREPLSGPVHVLLTFFLPRAPSVTRRLPYVKPDLDKLTRATFDALKGVAWIDDGQVVQSTQQKVYADDASHCGVEVEILPVLERV
jgi:Holliday junction resolvase RusA-like endonuclease